MQTFDERITHNTKRASKCSELNISIMFKEKSKIDSNAKKLCFARGE